MKYETIKVCGYRRSGTHYVTAIISTNFLDDPEYNRIYEKHRVPDKLKVHLNPKVAYVCVKRNFDDTIKSIFNMRDRFGLDVKSLKEMKAKTYKKMFNPKMGKTSMLVKTLSKTRTVNKIGGGLKNIALTPEAHWKMYYHLWESASRAYPNVYIISYDDLKIDFTSTMRSLATWLGSNVTKFNNIPQKIGWIVQ
jgi:hypothetical protein